MMIPKDALCIVALSGGADSVALLLRMIDEGSRVEAVHCNFHLRGEESDRDENFCRQLCTDKSIKLHVVHFDTRAYAQLHKVSIEMAARTLRYDYFRHLAHDIGAYAVCVAHHRDDSVETVLLNLIRGTGLNGLCGISAETFYGSESDGIPPLRVLRPMLGLSRQNIEDYLALKGQTYVTDSTNLSADDALRNRIRLEVMPLLRQINPSVANSIHRTSQRLSMLYPIVDNAICKDAEHCRISDGVYDVNAIKASSAPEYTLYYILREYAFSPQQIEDIYSHITSPTGRMFSNTRWRVLFDRDRLLVAPIKSGQRQYVLPEPAHYVLDGMKVNIDQFPHSESYTIPRTSDTLAIDADKVQWPLNLRSLRQGDRFRPFGMKGTKLVSDFLTDIKMSRFDREHQLLLTDASDTILWIVGVRAADGYRITPQTASVCEVKMLF